MDTTLQETLRYLMQSGSPANPALQVLIDDYTRYHLVLVVVGGAFLLGLVVLGIVLWRRFRRAPRRPQHGWTFEKKTYFSFAVVTVLVGMFMALVVAANVSTVINPRHGFSGSIGMLQSAPSDEQTIAFYGSVDAWLQSGSAETPTIVQDRIDERLSWQRPKAIICAVLLAAFVVVSALVWRRLIRTSRAPEARWTPGRLALLALGVISVLACLLLMLMVMGNTQGALAPISLTLFLG